MTAQTTRTTRRACLAGLALAPALALAAPAAAQLDKIQQFLTPKARVTYTVGPVALMPDGDQIIAVLTERLRALGLRPEIRQEGSALKITLAVPEDDGAIREALTRPGRFAVHTGVFPYYGCGEQPAGRICLENVATGDPYVIVDDPAALAGGIAAAEASADPAGNPALMIRLVPEAARTFGALTAGQTGKPLALALDGVVVLAPVVREPILGGEIMISGPGPDVATWAAILAQPPLPAPLTILATEVVQPD